ncbi:hypothetical protein PILCRDRAFT_12213 [Piloderma croceum F 1598]|uniref:Uncharacterized protein n=1 Tax=Piloderma croceum (strain F 1598) TaxID=765440 RepID=A0A0C3FBV8_PILCF|nr:hypothetical protein PILCRDRAFT_12213 [Piloderma croceum F 1598]
MDEVAGMAQAISAAHYQEVVDDHMNNSNWSKMIQIADSLCGKWKKAQEGFSTTKLAFEQLIDSLEPVMIDEWTNQERVAMCAVLNWGLQ